MHVESCDEDMKGLTSNFRTIVQEARKLIISCLERQENHQIFAEIPNFLGFHFINSTYECVWSQEMSLYHYVG